MDRNFRDDKARLVATSSTPTDCARCAVRARALFQGVPLDQLEWTQRYRENQYNVNGKSRLFDEGEDHPFAYTLYSGWVMLTSSAPSGRRQVLRFALPGDFLGFQARLDGPMSYSAYAITNCRLCAFPRDTLKRMMQERNELATRMAMLSARDMSFMQQVLLATGQKSARERVASLLLQLFARVQALGNLIPDSTEDTITFPLSQEILADALGMSAETVNRTLRDLREDGLLELKQRKLTVIDVERAMAVAELDMATIAEQALL